MQTIDLGATFADEVLEGVVLGIVYTDSQKSIDAARDPREDGRRGGGIRIDSLGDVELGKEAVLSESRARTLGCLEHAVKMIGERRQMDGVLEFERGRVTFLVYRID